MVIVKSLSELNFKNVITKIENVSFFYISRFEKLISYTDIFVYYYYIINKQLYITDFEFKQVFENIHNNITNKHHNQLLNNTNFNIINIDKGIVIRFVHSNAGHAYGDIMNAIYHINKNNLNDYKIIVTEELNNWSSFLMSILYFMFDKERIVIIDNNTLVNFNNTYIIKDYSLKTEESSIDFIKKLKLNDSLNQNNIPYYKNICLIKTKINICNTPHKQFNTEYNDYIKEKDFEIISPETYDIVTLFKIIYNAKNIIMSWGCCSYLNSEFINPNSNVLVLCHEGYRNEYISLLNYDMNILNTEWFPKICNKKLILFDLQYELTNDTKKLLDLKINNLLTN
jgi:hypothetical protein